MNILYIKDKKNIYTFSHGFDYGELIILPPPPPSFLLSYMTGHGNRKEPGIRVGNKRKNYLDIGFGPIGRLRFFPFPLGPIKIREGCSSAK